MPASEEYRQACELVSKTLLDAMGGVAVMVFFTISGYLVTQRWLREPKVLR